MANYSRIEECSLNNGKGIRTSIFFSGCQFYCRGCFNSELWDFNVGEEFTREVYETKIKPTITDHIAGLSCLGGEPLHPKNIESTLLLTQWFKEDFPDKNIWLWTGYSWENLIDAIFDYKLDDISCSNLEKVLINIDVLVDGQFIEEQKDLTLPWCGSLNQRVINVKESLKENKIVLYK